MVGKWPKCGERRMPAAGILEMVIVHLRQPVSCWFTDSIVWRFPAHRTVNPILCYRAKDYEISSVIPVCLVLNRVSSVVKNIT